MNLPISSRNTNWKCKIQDDIVIMYTTKLEISFIISLINEYMSLSVYASFFCLSICCSVSFSSNEMKWTFKKTYFKNSRSSQFKTIKKYLSSFIIKMD